MEEKSLRRIRRENIKRLEASLPPLEDKLVRASLEHKYCRHADRETGVCDVPEKYAQELVTKYAQEHAFSSKENSSWSKIGGGGGDQKGKKSKRDTDAEQTAAEARDNLINSVDEEKNRYDAESDILKQRINVIRDLINWFDFSGAFADDEIDEGKKVEGDNEKMADEGEKEEDEFEKVEIEGEKAESEVDKVEIEEGKAEMKVDNGGKNEESDNEKSQENKCEESEESDETESED